MVSLGELERLRKARDVEAAAKVDLGIGRPNEEEATVTGCLCTPFDVLCDQVSLPRAEVGDLIAISAPVPTA